MPQHRFGHLESIHIGYLNETKHILVTECGSKFYPNDLVFHKSIDIVFQYMKDEDKEWFRLMNEATKFTKFENLIFYLTEKEFNEYCGDCAKYFETSNSDECRQVKREITRKGHHKLRSWNAIARFFATTFQISHGVVFEKLMNYWRSRASENGRGIDGRVFERSMMVFGLAKKNVRRGIDQLSSMTKYQKLRKGRDLIVRIWCDRRTEDYNKWFVLGCEVLEAYHILLREQGKFTEQKVHNTPQYIPVKLFFEVFDDFGMDKKRVTLIPDIHFIRQWVELPLKVDYMCTTILGASGKMCCAENQAQFRIFQKVICDHHWLDSAEASCRKMEIISVMLLCAKDELYSFALIENNINGILSENRFLDAMNRDIKTPLRICNEKKLTDYITLSEFKELVDSYVGNGLYVPEEFNINYESDKIAIWKVRYIFLNHWIRTFLHDDKQLTMNMMTALTMNFDFHMIDEDKEYDDPSKYWIDVQKYKLFEEKVERIRMDELEVLAQDVAQGPSASNFKQESVNTSDDQNSDETENIKVDDENKSQCEIPISASASVEKEVHNQPEASSMAKSATEKKSKDHDEATIVDDIPQQTVEVVVEEADVSKLERCEGCGDKEKYTDEILDLTRQLDEKSKLLEEQRNQIKRGEKLIEQLRKDLEESQIATENAKIEEKNAKELAKNTKKDYKKTLQEQEQKMKKQNEHIEKLETNLKKIKENAKTNSERTNMETEKELGVANEKMNKLKRELENSKLHETTAWKKVSELEKQNEQLKATNAEKDQTIQELTEKVEEYQRILGDIEEHFVGDGDLEEPELEEQVQESSLAVNTGMCHSSTSSEASPTKKTISSNSIEKCSICLSEIENDDKDVLECEVCHVKHHDICLSPWLNECATCPACRRSFPNPREFPAL